MTEGDTGDDRSSNYTFETRLDDRLSTYSNISLDDRPLSFGSGPDGTLVRVPVSSCDQLVKRRAPKW